MSREKDKNYKSSLLVQSVWAVVAPLVFLTVLYNYEFPESDL